MKQLNTQMCSYHKLYLILFILFGLFSETLSAQDSAASHPILGISYFLPVSKTPYLQISTKKKVGRKFEPVKNIRVNVYLNDADPKNLIGEVVTDTTGLARIGLPPSFKGTWDSLNEFKFLAHVDSSSSRGALDADITIKKAILTVDTTTQDGARMVTGTLKEKNGNDWVPVKDIDIRLAIKRMHGNLSVGDKETYTSDSTGVSSAEFKRDSIPGDEKGNIILVAQVDDNDTYGNLVTEKTAGWGKALQPSKNFFAQRTLWSTARETPLWLLFTVWIIVAGIWGTIIYLVFQILKIKRMGRVTQS